jgi:hypothetical protein
MAAAHEMPDEKHPKLERDPADNNEDIYILSSISGHNMAILCLPAGRISNNLAAAVAPQMQATFQHVRFRLMVGNITVQRSKTGSHILFKADCNYMAGQKDKRLVIVTQSCSWQRCTTLLGATLICEHVTGYGGV